MFISIKVLLIAGLLALLSVQGGCATPWWGHGHGWGGGYHHFP